MLQSETTTARIAFAQADNMLNVSKDERTNKSVTFDKSAELPNFNGDTGRSVDKMQRVFSVPQASESTREAVKVLKRSQSESRIQIKLASGAVSESLKRGVSVGSHGTVTEDCSFEDEENENEEVTLGPYDGTMTSRSERGGTSKTRDGTSRSRRKRHPKYRI